MSVLPVSDLEAIALSHDAKKGASSGSALPSFWPYVTGNSNAPFVH